MTPNELRETWLTFFEERGHTRWPSASLVPENDPTLLFTGAGMNQFKDMFLGKGNLPFRRATTVQKCFRQGDLDNVGRTPRHLTFFEMMGHFSFGDYFKREAVAWAWEFLRTVADLPVDRLVVSVYREDDEAFEAWRAVGFPADRIARFDARENFWPANAPEDGPNGPCGPCSEIFFDYGKDAEKGDGGPNGWDSGRFVEIWNMVFTQFDRRGVNDLVPLPQRNIDTGAGFERVLAAMERQQSPFGTTLFRPILRAIAALARREYEFRADGSMPSDVDSQRMRRIADHARGACMLVADGVKPSNEGRGYVLRRVLRRAIRDGIQLGLDEPFLARLVASVIETMGEAYPNVAEGRIVIPSVLEGEERRFRETYGTGLRYLEEEIERLGGAKVLSGEAAFRLHDTYGFPLDLAEVILQERGIRVDHAVFEREMDAQRDRARKGSKIKGDIFAGGPLTELKSRGAEATRFSGYEGRGVEGRARVLGIVAGDALAPRAETGAEVHVVLDRTPFYAESGGQVGDTGLLVAPTGRVRVSDTRKAEGFHLHVGTVEDGFVEAGTEVDARVDTDRRDDVRRNHTATHLLHKVLKTVLGDHVRQEGSLVAPDRLRFDFSHPRPVGEDEIARIEEIMNGWILANATVATESMDLEAAKASGAVAMFGEKYDAKVRVLDVPGLETSGGPSRELCGGTHCSRTGDIGSFRVTLETSIAAGVRRIEAVTGRGAARAFAEDRAVLRDLAQRLKARPEEIAGRVQALQDEVRDARRAAEKARQEAALGAIDRLGEKAEDVEGLRVLAAPLPGVDAKAMKGLWERLKKDGVQVAFLAGESDAKVPVFAAASPEGVARGIDARALLETACGILGGRGGGRPEMAQGNGERPDRIAEAIEAVRSRIRESAGATSRA